MPARRFLLRHDVRYAGKTSWSKTFYRWLATLNFGVGRADGVHRILAGGHGCRRARRAAHQALASSIEGWRFEPVVNALQALRGIDQISAIGLVAEIGDIARFAHPRQLMALSRSCALGAFQRRARGRGSITKTGNAHARRLLTEAAWNYRFQPRIGRRAQRRAEDLPQAIRDVAWKAAAGRCAKGGTIADHAHPLPSPVVNRALALLALHAAVLLFGFAGLFGKWLACRRC